MKLEAVLNMVKVYLPEEEEALLTGISEEVVKLRKEINSIDQEQAQAIDYERVLIKMGEFVLGDIEVT